MKKSMVICQLIQNLLFLQNEKVAQIEVVNHYFTLKKMEPKLDMTSPK